MKYLNKKKNSSAIWLAITVLISGCYVQELKSVNSAADNHSHKKSHTDTDSSQMNMNDMAHMSHGKAGTLLYTSRANSVTTISEGRKYRVTLFSNESPVPVKKIHSWTVHVEDMSGIPFEEGKVYVSGGMPMHNHGFPTVPKIKKYLGNGDYKVEGIKFNMHGHWVMDFNIQSGRNTDYAQFKINLQPDVSLVNDKWSQQELLKITSLWIGNLSDLFTHSTNRVSDNPEAARLGQKIFFDTRFSANGQVACANCHKPELYFTDGLKVGQGLGAVERNSPTIVGAGYHTWFFRDGRADSLWSQALSPLEDRQEHGGSRSQYAHAIYNDPGYRASYEKLFGAMPDLSDKLRFPAKAGPVRDKKLLKTWGKMGENERDAVTTVFVNIAKSIAAYERLLKPAPSRFDNYVEAVMDNDNAKMSELMSAEEVAGLKLFVGRANCTLCHNGPMFTDFIFHNIATPPVNVKRYDFGRQKAVNRVKNSPFNCNSEYNDSEDKQCGELKYIVLHEEDTKAAFKTPGLRNVSKTAPYMHAGQYATLSDVMSHYAEPPPTKVGLSDLLPVKLNKTEQKQLEAFLLTLDSAIDADPRLLAPL